MEFKYREGDNRSTAYRSPSPSVGFLTEQAALQAANATRNFSANQCHNGVDRIITFEINGELIQGKIIAEEFVPRETEVMKMENEWPNRSGMEISSVSSFQESQPMLFNSRFSTMNYGGNNQHNQRLAFGGHHGSNFHGLSPPMPLIQEVIGEVVETPSLKANKGKEKVIMLTRHDLNKVKPKRKAEPPQPVTDTAEAALSRNEKKAKKWSCELRQVSSTSEINFNNHLQGRKHRVEEAKLWSSDELKNEMPPNPMVSVSPMETIEEEFLLEQNKIGIDSGKGLENGIDINDKKFEANPTVSVSPMETTEKDLPLEQSKTGIDSGKRLKNGQAVNDKRVEANPTVSVSPMETREKKLLLEPSKIRIDLGKRLENGKDVNEKKVEANPTVSISPMESKEGELLLEQSETWIDLGEILEYWQDVYGKRAKAIPSMVSVSAVEKKNEESLLQLQQSKTWIDSGKKLDNYKKAEEALAPWSCALCQITTTCEVALTAHLHGRKHKAKEARLGSDKPETSSQPPIPMTTGELPEPMEAENTGPVTDTEVVEESVRESKSGNDSDQKLINEEHTNAENETATVERTLETQKEKKFSFWCEMCKKGATCKIVMDDHLRGKKHRSGLLKLV